MLSGVCPKYLRRPSWAPLAPEFDNDKRGRKVRNPIGRSFNHNSNAENKLRRPQSKGGEKGEATVNAIQLIYHADAATVVFYS